MNASDFWSYFATGIRRIGEGLVIGIAAALSFYVFQEFTKNAESLERANEHLREQKVANKDVYDAIYAIRKELHRSQDSKL